MMMNNNMFMNNMGNMNMNTMNTMGNMGNMNMNNMNNMGNMGNMNMNTMNNMGNMGNMGNMNMNNNQNQMMLNNMQQMMMMMNNNQATMNQMANTMGQFNNNQISNQMPNQMNNSQLPSSNDHITVVFRLGAMNERNTHIIEKNGPTISIQCMADDKVESIIKRYRQKTGFKEKAKFIYNAKNLNPSLTVAEAGITNNSFIFVISTEEVYGGY